MKLLSFVLCFLFVELITGLVTTRDNGGEPDEMRNILGDVKTSCKSGDDALACMKLKIIQYVETMFYKGDNEFKQHFEVRSNGVSGKSRASSSFTEFLEQYLEEHEINVKFPSMNTQVIVSPRNIDTNEIDFKLKFDSDLTSNGNEARRSKLKRVIVPIMVLILLKAMTFIPLAIGVLGLKAFNSLQLGVASFLLSAGLAIFQICKKLALDHYTPHVISHPHWEGRAAEDSNDESHNIVFNAYV